ncbi:hypothetical protein [Ekhidna sp. To15]|uniref:hypothetical protein n=1 Tax=Ekhidna sp. To15 TaxID=3395267 RepID=UPI003F51E5C9
MPTTIPYDPSLVLGNIVSRKKLDLIEKIAAAQAPVNAAEDELNSLITMKRSLDMTIQELVNMNVPTKKISDENEKVGEQIEKAAAAYGTAKLKAEQTIQPLRSQIASISDNIESPMDYNKSNLKKMPLSSDSLKMNSQYFSFDRNEQTSGSHAATIASYVSETLSVDDWFASGSETSTVKNSVQTQVSSQHQNHEISGTLVITINCTHKDAVLLAPYIMDVDKGIRAWNAEFPDDMLNILDMSSIEKAMGTAAKKGENTMNILSGATYGSCFVGMVHVLNTTETDSSQSMMSVAESVQGQFEIASWWAHVSGGYGADSSFTNDAKSLLSTQNVTSHCTLTVMGSIPSIKANTVDMFVKEFNMNDDPLAGVQKLQGATAGEIDSIGASAEAARTGAQMVAMQSAKVQSALSALSDSDKKSNEILDTNSMMDAMQDYISKCLDGNIGIPINFYTKPITKSELAGAWLRKYYPSKMTQKLSSGDDSGSDSSSGGDSDAGGSGS